MLRADNGEAGWCRAELYRAKGEWLLAQGAPGAAKAAEALFQRSLELARQQGARAWELRAAMSLMHLWQPRERAEGLKLLAGVLQHFTEGHASADVLAAKALLDSAAPTADAIRPHARRRRPA